VTHDAISRGLRELQDVVAVQGREEYTPKEVASIQ
jgi:hypothetical protein